MMLKPEQRIPFVISLLSVIVLTVLAIYLTPLKHLNLVPPTMHEMDPKAFYADYTAHPDKYIFIDVRSSNIYLSAHAQGAINIPIENLTDQHYQLPKSGKQIVLICTSGRLAEIAYGYLQNWGFLNLIHITGGLQNWLVEGLPVVGQNVSTSTVMNADNSDAHQ